MEVEGIILIVKGSGKTSTEEGEGEAITPHEASN